MMKKRILMITAALIASLTFILSSCGKSSDEIEVDMSALSDAMAAADKTMPEMLRADGSSSDAETLFAYLSELSYEKVSDYFYLYSSDGSPYEIAVIELISDGDASLAAQTLHTHIAKRTATYATYKKEYTSQAENADVVSQGRYVALIMTSDNDSVKATFREYTEAK